MTPSPEFGNEIHARLLQGDPTAPDEAADVYLEPLQLRLRQLGLHVRDDAFYDEAAINALWGYLKRPERYDPARGDLFNYLVTAGRGDLLNALAADARRKKRELSLYVVEEGEGVRNPIKEDCESRLQELLDRLGLASLEDVWARVEQVLPDPVEQQVLKLMLAGERATSVFAPLLGLQNADAEEQERDVKRCKDRIVKRLERLGKRMRDEGGDADE